MRTLLTLSALLCVAAAAPAADQPPLGTCPSPAHEWGVIDGHGWGWRFKDRTLGAPPAGAAMATAPVPLMFGGCPGGVCPTGPAMMMQAPVSPLRTMFLGGFGGGCPGGNCFRR